MQLEAARLLVEHAGKTSNCGGGGKESVQAADVRMLQAVLYAGGWLLARSTRFRARCAACCWLKSRDDFIYN